jgi:hypothetical protein
MAPQMADGRWLLRWQMAHGSSDGRWHMAPQMADGTWLLRWQMAHGSSEGRWHMAPQMEGGRLKMADGSSRIVVLQLSCEPLKFEFVRPAGDKVSLTVISSRPADDCS